MAYEVLTSLQQTLTRTLERLQQASVGRPWWASLLPRLGVWATQRKLERRLSGALGEQVERHDRQVQAWLTACLSHLIAAYEAHAEFHHEQVRRLDDHQVLGDGGLNGHEGEDLEADLRRLRASS
jgi:hypothetical protein